MAVRRVRRIIRRIDPWTVLKVSVVFNAIVALIFVLGTWVMWSLALRRGIPDRVVDIFESLTLTVTIEGELYFRIVVLLAIIGAILATAFMTLGAVLYNLIADLVGGVEIAVLEETYRPAATRTRMSVAPVDQAPGTAAPPLPHTMAPPPEAEPVAPAPDRPIPEPMAPGDPLPDDSPVEMPVQPAANTEPVADTGDEEAAAADTDDEAADEETSRVRAS